MGLNLSDRQLNIDCSVPKRLYTNLMVIKRKESKYIVKESQQIIREQEKKGTEKNYKRNHKISNKMAIST